jgi:hypothetical protein
MRVDALMPALCWRSTSPACTSCDDATALMLCSVCGCRCLMHMGRKASRGRHHHQDHNQQQQQQVEGQAPLLVLLVLAGHSSHPLALGLVEASRAAIAGWMLHVLPTSSQACLGKMGSVDSTSCRAVGCGCLRGRAAAGGK